MCQKTGIETPNDQRTGCVVGLLDIEKVNRAIVTDVIVFSENMGMSLKIQWSVNGNAVHEQTTDFNVSVSVTKRFDGWKDDGNKQVTRTYQVDKSLQFLILDVGSPSFPINVDENTKGPTSLWHLARFVRVKQFSSTYDTGGAWSTVSDSWTDANDCLDTWVDVVNPKPVEWRCCPCPPGAACDRVPKNGIVARQGFWRIPSNYFNNQNFTSELDVSVVETNDKRKCTHAPKFVLCPYQERCLGILPDDREIDPSLEGCVVGTEGPRCALCSNGFAREGSSCSPCTKDAFAKKAAVFAGVLFLGLCFLLLARILFRKMPRRLKKMRKDLFRILIIVVNFSQIGTSLPSVLNVKWPANYLRLLDTLNVFNFNVMELTGVSCATKINHSAKLMAMACFPLVLSSFAVWKWCRGRRKSKSRIAHASMEVHAVLWAHAVEQSFDVIDHEGSELIEKDELVEFFKHLDTTITEEEAQKKIQAWTKNPKALGLTRKQFVSIFTEDADKHEFATRQQQDKAIAWTDAFVTVSKALSGVGELMFAIHAPVSQAAFEWFWFVKLGDELVLRVDPTIFYQDARWFAILPVAFFVLVVLTIG